MHSMILAAVVIATYGLVLGRLATLLCMRPLKIKGPGLFSVGQMERM